MASESITGTPYVRTGTEFEEEEYHDEQRAVEDPGVSRSGVRNEAVEPSGTERREEMVDQAAAETLVQFREQRSQESVICGDGMGRQEQNMHLRSDRSWSDPSFNNGLLPPHHAFPNSRDGVNVIQNPFLYSEPNLQNTILGLSRALGTMQQNQADLHQKQETFTGALQNVVEVLHELRNEGTIGRQRDERSMSYRGTVSNTTSQDRYQEEVQGSTPGTDVHQANSTDPESNLQEHDVYRGPASSSNADNRECLTGAIDSMTSNGTNSRATESTDETM
ncbi:MAG: hypothetical protein JAY75_20390, partial [Candidatus Thiodiazotropha taylori]|nr:hypothetical protein [Candidatus Thiodiazotropha taylori]MCW4310580.1 hypothetical protein [Candidatus Thiodiazotropha endolucinida]